MSYCRWTDESDVYCYEDCMGGFTTHVAGQRLKPGAELPDLWAAGQRDEDFWAAIDASYEPVGFACDGETFNDSDLESLLDRLLELRAMGYKVPEYAIESVREEMNDARCVECGEVV